MKKMLCMAVILIGLTALVSSCKKEEDEPAQMEITVKDENGNVVQGAEVTLYKSERDFFLDENQVGEAKTTNAQGKVKFEGLEEANYWFLAEDGCETNALHGSRTASPLKNGQITTFNATISPAAIVVYVNEGSSTFGVYINSIYVGDVLSGEFKAFPVIPGTHLIQAAVNPAVVGFEETVTLDCGEIYESILE